MSASGELHKGLKQRQLNMIAIGGVIGAGLFVGSGVVISKTGPAAFLSYALAGVLIVLVMRMLGEMATANPSTGSFTEYARKGLGGWAGFSTAWLYWYFWVIVVGFEAVAGAKVINYWVEAPTWLLSLILLVLMTATNLYSVSSFGEFEFWFAGIKVTAITVFLVLGTLFVLGLWPGRNLDFGNLYAHGGFLPNGAGAIFSAIVIVIFSMVGAEIVTIAAAESPDPTKAIARATNSVVTRILIFFVGSVFLLAVILPWNSTELAASPYVTALKAMGIPYADHLMNAVVLTAVLSCLNSGLYTASRMLFVLSGQREAPMALTRVTDRGVPANAILTSTIVGYLCVIAAAISPDTIFAFLLNSSGAIILFVYLLIALSQIVLRRRTDPSKLIVKMWFFPVLSILAVVGIIAVLVQMAFDKEVRSQLILSLLVFGATVACYFVLARRRGEEPAPARAQPDTPAQRVLILANETVESPELLQRLEAMDPAHTARYYVCVPANPVDTGTTNVTGAVWIRQATVEAAQHRLDNTLAAMQTKRLQASGDLGDFLPMTALENAVASFSPDHIVIVTHPTAYSLWLHADVVGRARKEFPSIPVTHVVADRAHLEAAAAGPPRSTPD